MGPTVVSVLTVGFPLMHTCPCFNENLNFYMKLNSKLGGCMSLKTKLFKGLQSVRGEDDPSHTYQNGVECSNRTKDLKG
eukprot:1146596-Pelagomonas_calceolata.AAC.5